MNYTVGFDLGTHQTKICIQDASNAAEKIYEFLEFAKPDGTTTVLFPSIVQINTDRTVSYGYADNSKSLRVPSEIFKKPILLLKELPIEPILPTKRKAKYPQKPIAILWKDILLKFKGAKTTTDIWKQKCAQVDSDIQKDWDEQCKQIRAVYESSLSKVLSTNKQITDTFNQKLKDWEKSQEMGVCRYRYFKLHAFTGSGVWNSKNFDSKEICVWYIAYILILIRNRFGDDISIQFGAPVGGSGSQRDNLITDRVYSLYIAAYNLAEHYNSLEEYMSANYIELRNFTRIERVNGDIKNQYIFDDIPEAFAGLVSVTAQKKLGSGFHLLVDIGGGTTDMAMFFVDDTTHLPDVVSIISFANGLNFIFENTQTNLSIEELQNEFFKNSNNKIFCDAVTVYKEKLVYHGSNLENLLIKSFDDSREHHGKSLSDLEQALKNQPIIYCGGGSVYDIIQSNIGSFTDKRKINKELLSIRNVRNDKNISKELYAILAISYGLASYEKPFDKGIKCTDVSMVFRKCLPKAEKKEYKIEYGLLDD